MRAPQKREVRLSLPEKRWGVKAEGIHHIAYQVDDIDQALRDLKAKGARLVDEQPRKGIHNSRIAFLNPQSSYGVVIELVEQEK
jgi:methylmalonyl-CoA/ethylmalonyl-CoA epimerase